MVPVIGYSCGIVWNLTWRLDNSFKLTTKGSLPYAVELQQQQTFFLQCLLRQPRSKEALQHHLLQVREMQLALVKIFVQDTRSSAKTSAVHGNIIIADTIARLVAESVMNRTDLDHKVRACLMPSLSTQQHIAQLNLHLRHYQNHLSWLMLSYSLGASTSSSSLALLTRMIMQLRNYVRLRVNESLQRVHADAGAQQQRAHVHLSR